MKILVGFTGFVGQNLINQLKFDKIFNSKNIHEAYGLKPDLCIYCGVKAEKYIANSFPDNDLRHIHDTIGNIKQIMPKKLILISTVDVLDCTEDVDEDYEIKFDNLAPYGKNRRFLEIWVQKNLLDFNIVRLPAIYGLNLKKNFIFDIINPIPKLLTKNLFSKFKEKSILVSESYKIDNDFYYLDPKLSFFHMNKLKLELINKNLSSIFFTDSRSIFQFYPIKYLAKHIEFVSEQNLHISHLVTEPLLASDVYYYLNNKVFVNEISQKYPKYNIKTKYSHFMGKNPGYLLDKNEVLADIKDFVSMMKLPRD
jgi:hypothetical protein